MMKAEFAESNEPMSLGGVPIIDCLPTDQRLNTFSAYFGQEILARACPEFRYRFSKAASQLSEQEYIALAVTTRILDKTDLVGEAIVKLGLQTAVLDAMLEAGADPFSLFDALAEHRSLKLSSSQSTQDRDLTPESGRCDPLPRTFRWRKPKAR